MTRRPGPGDGPAGVHCVLRPHTELTPATVGDVLNRWLTLVDTHQPTVVTIDLSALEIVDRTGLKMLRLLRSALRQREIACRLRGPFDDDPGTVPGDGGDHAVTGPRSDP